MALHIAKTEYEERTRKTLALLRQQSLAGMLIFRQESMYWLTGYDTAGYSQFQCLWLGADGYLLLLTRSSDIRQAKATSTITDIRLWQDAEGANPAEVLRAQLAPWTPPGARIGVEYAAAGLNAQRGRLIDTAFSDLQLIDTSELISSLRVIKSASELTFVRQAGRIADDAWRAALAACQPGGSESDLLATIYATVIRAGGDPAAGRFVCGAGENALLCRYFTGKGEIAVQDQVTVEFAAAYRHYHVALMRTIIVGEASVAQLRMHEAVVLALEACRQQLRPGNTYGDLFGAHARILDEKGYKKARLNACGYSLGACFPPTWMDWPMCYEANPVRLEPGMVVFLHMILFDDEAGLSMSLGETFVVTDAEPERLSSLDHGLVQVAQ
ncbi:M24 family metallopeptidase [Brenneria tiliae]|uniref:Xaa-Pro peptidase family protein n=1 Tax=Brenneria tiliae TaxID=2914984 RepID=A0ABT0MP95_9GAMM|nr:Xaa-Pro peptidase family protein [Brenneria tiliae]MCL2891663.1 Xaa-Pro peptidase family protein [Brenneria tiliae]